MKTREAAGTQTFRALEHQPVGQRQALQHAAHDSPVVSGTGCPDSWQAATIVRGHVLLGLRKRGSFGSISERKGSRISRGCPYRLIPMPLTIPFPTPSAAFDQPEAHDVFEEPIRAVYSAFVGEVPGKGLGIDNRVRKLRSKQRPGPRTEVREVARPWNGNDG